MADPVLDALSTLVARLKMERQRALDRGLDVADRINAHIARIDRKLALASGLIDERRTDEGLYQPRVLRHSRRH
jgi:hypothetical protein